MQGTVPGTKSPGKKKIKDFKSFQSLIIEKWYKKGVNTYYYGL